MNFTNRSTYVFSTLILAVTSFQNNCNAQFGHSDVDLASIDGTIVTNQRVYESFFPTFGIAKQFSTNPGFAAESDGLGTIGTKQDLIYDVQDSLLLWNETGFVPIPEEVRIRIDNNPPGSADTIVDPASGIQLGSFEPPINRIGASSASGEVHSHVNFFLEPQDSDETPPMGAYGVKLSLTTNEERTDASDPIFLVFNHGLDEGVFEQGMAVFETLLDEPTLDGDFNSNGQLDVEDIDLLTSAVLSNETDTRFDLNSDAQINQDDRQTWVEGLRFTYFGDSNLDGEFSSADFVAVFQRGEYEDLVPMNSNWADGDWNGDGDFSSSDFVLAFQSGGYELGPRSIANVPEPSGTNPILIALLSYLVCAQFRTKLTTSRAQSRCS